MTTRMMILALSLSIGAVPATAADIDKTAATVRMDDLNLTRTADRERLDTRLKNAAQGVCTSGRRGAAESALRSACMSAALAQAEAQAEQAIAQAQGGTRLALLMIKPAQ